MKNSIKFLVFSFCIGIGFIQAQSIEPIQLKYNCRKLLCEKGSRKPYSGEIKGFLSILHSVNVANIRIGLTFNSLEMITREEERGFIDSLYLVGQVSQGKETGRWQYYYTKDKILLMEVDFVNGIIDGELIVYYSNGNIETHEMYKNGKSNGIASYYSKNGEIISKSLYENDCFIKEIPKEEW